MRTLLGSLLLLAIAGCSPDTPPTSTPPTSTPPETTQSEKSVAPEPIVSTPELSESPAKKAIVVDVRSKEEWDSGHVDQAIHIPHTEIAERVSEVSDNKDAKIVVYCAAGGRAGKAKTALEELGFTNVENGGGYDDVKDRYRSE